MKESLVPLIAVLALSIGAASLYSQATRRSCECPANSACPCSPDHRPEPKPLRPRRPDGATGEDKAGLFVDPVSGIVQRGY